MNSNLSSLEYPTCIYFAIQIVAQCGAICNNMCRIKGSTGEQKCNCNPFWTSMSLSIPYYLKAWSLSFLLIPNIACISFTVKPDVLLQGDGGVNRGIQIRRSAQIWSKIRDPIMVLSKFESAKSSTMTSQSRIRTKLQVKFTIRAKTLDKSAIRCINKIGKSV